MEDGATGVPRRAHQRVNKWALSKPSQNIIMNSSKKTAQSIIYKTRSESPPKHLRVSTYQKSCWEDNTVTIPANTSNESIANELDKVKNKMAGFVFSYQKYVAKLHKKIEKLEQEKQELLLSNQTAEKLGSLDSRNSRVT